jgi:hypothetical protein
MGNDDYIDDEGKEVNSCRVLVLRKKGERQGGKLQERGGVLRVAVFSAATAANKGSVARRCCWG